MCLPCPSRGIPRGLKTRHVAGQKPSTRSKPVSLYWEPAIPSTRLVDVRGELAQPQLPGHRGWQRNRLPRPPQTVGKRTARCRAAALPRLCPNDGWVLRLRETKSRKTIDTKHSRLQTKKGGPTLHSRLLGRTHPDRERVRVAFEAAEDHEHAVGRVGLIRHSHCQQRHLGSTRPDAPTPRGVWERQTKNKQAGHHLLGIGLPGSLAHSPARRRGAER